MRVLIFSLAYTPFIGGAELAIKEIANLLPDIDFDMITVNLDGKQKAVEQINNIAVYRVGSGKWSKYFFPWLAVSKARKLHNQKHYQLVWAMMANQAGLAAVKFKKKFPQVKYLLTLQEGDSLKRIWSRTWLIRPIYKNIYRRADLIQPISNFLAQRAKKYGYSGEIEIVPNGVDLSQFTAEFSAQELLELKQQLGFDAADKIVVTTSRLTHKNGLDVLIKAVKDLPVKLLIIGSGELETELKRLVKKLNLEDKVIFKGYLDISELPKYLKISDIFVRASRSEGLGTSFLEAMAAGLPIIGTNVGGIPDFLQDKITGLFCRVNDVQDLSNSINLLLQDRELYLKIKESGKKLVIENYSWNKVAEKIKIIIKNI